MPRSYKGADSLPPCQTQPAPNKMMNPYPLKSLLLVGTTATFAAFAFAPTYAEAQRGGYGGNYCSSSSYRSYSPRYYPRSSHRSSYSRSHSRSHSPRYYSNSNRSYNPRYYSKSSRSYSPSHQSGHGRSHGHFFGRGGRSHR